MKTSILMTLVMLLSFSCIKKEQEKNTESQIVDLLNQNQSDEALTKINEELKSNPTDELYYLKASTLSMKAGVDIYSLFPLLKVKIFDVAISQWSQNREFQKKIESQRTDIVSHDNKEDPKKEEVYTPLDTTDLKYNIISNYLTWDYSAGKGFCEIAIGAQFEDNFSGEGAWLTIQEKSEDLCNEYNSDRNVQIFPGADEAIKKALSEYHKRMWFERKKKISDKGNYVKVLGTFWTIIDLVPMLSKIPKISNDGFKSLEEAQDILAKILVNHPDKNDELGSKAKKQLMMISALKIVGHVQNGFNLQSIKSPMDVLCNSNEQAAAEIIACEKDTLHLLNNIEDPEILKKNKELFGEIKSKYEIMSQEQEDNPELKDQRIQKLANEVMKYKKSNCD